MSRKETKKVYHGVPKSTPDEHTIFYASFDGTNQPEVVGTDEISSSDTTFRQSPTGAGLYCINYSNSNYKNIILTVDECLTVDFWAHNTCTVRFYNGTHNHYILNQVSDRLTSWSNNSPIDIVGKVRGLEFNHFRIIFRLDSITCYVNGNRHELIVSQNNLSFLSSEIYMRLFNKYGHDADVYNRIGGPISDLHISNIDRGDYFPTLPQDFIDGKAIIKPRLGQQQIKGDPVYSQVTNVRIPCTTNSIKGNWSTKGSDGFVTLIHRPEIKSDNTNYEEAGAKVKISSLDTGIISGLIDTNTALCRVIKPVINSNIIYVDNINGIQQGDTIRLINSTLLNLGEYNVVSVNKESVSITINGNIGISTDVYIYETTISSSSPIVKTQNGIDVIGSWTGLGTTEAVFTLGSNSNITGKDLYVTYSLTFNPGNSDFKELPDVNSMTSESGVKLEPTNALYVEDDFMGKIQGKDTICPHKAFVITDHSSLVNPTTLSTNEIATASYSKMSINNPLNYYHNAITTASKIAQVICKFNIIDMIETKFGCEIPSHNKVQWVKDNLKNTVLYLNGTGNNKMRLESYSCEQSRWYITNLVSSSSIHTLLLYTNDNNSPNNYAAKTIDDNGFVYYAIYTDAHVSGTTTLDISYVKFEVELNYDSTFKLLYSKNTRAREDKCMPMLVQKETKTIKSYIETRDSFTTEYNYNEFKGKSIVTPQMDDMTHSNSIYMNSMGTGRLPEHYNDIKYLSSLSNITDKPTHIFNSEPIKKADVSIYGSDNRLSSPISMKSRGSSYANNLYGLVITNDSNIIANNFVQILPAIITLDNIHYLFILSEFFENRQYVTAQSLYFPIPNTPLIK